MDLIEKCSNFLLFKFQVFNRLLGTHNNDSGIPHTSPITPAELLIALHTIDSNKAELKTVIKGIFLFLFEILFSFSLMFED